MPEQKITITIDDDGGITAKTQGFKGTSCLAALEDLLDLDTNVSQMKKTDEYHQQLRLNQTCKQEIKS